MKKKDLREFRREYSVKGLEESGLPADPVNLFSSWLNDAIEQGLTEPNAMTLATAGSDCRPNARIVLLKEVSGGNFVFFTNYESRKGIELEQNPYASAVFLWLELHRQVRIRGRVEKLSPRLSDEYFSIRPRGSQLGALVSQQSRPVTRSELESRFAQEQKRLEGSKVQRPRYWGGYTLNPDSIEFWHGRESRLHDRILYRKSADSWVFERLAP